MMTPSETGAFLPIWEVAVNDDRYLARSWALLTSPKGWIKPVLVLTAASYVPIVGGIGVDGYALEWARLTAWGIDAAPKQRNVDIPACIISGARALVVSLLLGVIVGIPMGVIRAIAVSFDGDFGNFLALVVGLVTFCVTLLANAAIMVAKLRVAIYEKMIAGFGISNIFEMIRRDNRGFLRILGISLLRTFIMVIAVIAMVVVFSVCLMPVFYSVIRADEVEALRSLANACIPIALACVPAGFILSFVSTIFTLLQYNAVGLWMRKFNVPAWGNPDDPLPN